MKKILFFSLFLFGVIYFVIIKYFNDYTQRIIENYINTIKHEINILISEHRSHALAISRSFLLNEDVLYAIQYKNYYLLNSLISTKFKINFIDNNGVLQFSSFAKPMEGKNVSKIRPCIQEALKEKKEKAYINAGVYGISIKGDVPVIIHNKFYGILESVLFFDSIIKELKKQHIFSLIVLTKKTSKKIKYQKLGHLEHGYFILNNSNHELLKYDTIPHLLKIKTYKYIDNFFVVKVPLKEGNETLGYIIAFVKDVYNLKEKELIIKALMFVLVILFLVIYFIAYKVIKEKETRIKDLYKSIKEEMKKNIELIYVDLQTGAYKKAKFDIDKNMYHNEYAVMLNIKNFSKINELYGFKTGDKILKELSKRLKELLKRPIYRIHADEFVFFSQDFEKEINLIKNNFKEYPLNVEGMNLILTFTFSVAKNDSEDILRKLSIAQKEAKSKVFQDFVMFQDKVASKDFIKFNAYLYDALYEKKEAQIVPYFQPIVDNETLKPVKYEVLARLKTKEKVYSPFFFLDVARSSGFLADLTKEVIIKSFQTAKEKDIDLSINITDEDLLIEGFKDFLIEKIKEFNLKPKQITLEILENITSKDTNRCIEQIKELKEAGFLIAIDDFGVEYSNFERISDLDVDFIKIDGKYIKEIKNPKNYQIVKAISQFAESMGILTIAEFVEDEEIFNIVKELNIKFSQGYFFSPPKEEI